MRPGCLGGSEGREHGRDDRPAAQGDGSAGGGSGAEADQKAAGREVHTRSLEIGHEVEPDRRRPRAGGVPVRGRFVFAGIAWHASPWSAVSTWTWSSGPLISPPPGRRCWEAPLPRLRAAKGPIRRWARRAWGRRWPWWAVWEMMPLAEPCATAWCAKASRPRGYARMRVRRPAWRSSPWTVQGKILLLLPPVPTHP